MGSKGCAPARHVQALSTATLTRRPPKPAHSLGRHRRPFATATAAFPRNIALHIARRPLPPRNVCRLGHVVLPSGTSLLLSGVPLRSLESGSASRRVAAVMPGADERLPSTVAAPVSDDSAQRTQMVVGKDDTGFETGWDGTSGRYAWIRENMHITRAVADKLPQDLSDVRLACCMHLDAKMSAAVFPLLRRGASLFLTTCNPDTVDDAFVAKAAAEGASTAAWRGMSSSEWDESLLAALRWGPTHICDMGAQLSVKLMELAAKDGVLPLKGGPAVQAALEATGSGITRLESLPTLPPYPVYNWDDVPVKSHVHNRHMVGLTAMCALYQATQLTLHGKRVLVIGGGLVGQGMAESARSFGASMVTVAELDPVRALTLQFDRINVVTPHMLGGSPDWMDAALGEADVVITATGARHVIGTHNVHGLKDGAILLNVGHASDEIDADGLLSSFPHSRMMENVERIEISGPPLLSKPVSNGKMSPDISAETADATPGGEGGPRVVYLIARGCMINLAAAEGDSLNAFDVTLATMLAGIDFLCREHAVPAATGAANSFSGPGSGCAAAGLHLLPEHVCAHVAAIQLSQQGPAATASHH